MRGVMRGSFVATAAIFPVLMAGMLVPARAFAGERGDTATSSTASAGMSNSYQQQEQTVVALPYNATNWVYEQVPWGADPSFYGRDQNHRSHCGPERLV